MHHCASSPGLSNRSRRPISSLKSPASRLWRQQFAVVGAPIGIANVAADAHLALQMADHVAHDLVRHRLIDDSDRKDEKQQGRVVTPAFVRLNAFRRQYFVEGSPAS